MAIEQPNLSISVPAGADLSTKQFFMVKLDSSGNLVLATLGDKITGILQDKPLLGEAGNVMVEGISKIVAGAAIAAGATIASDANGKAKTVATGQEQEGEMLEAAGADLEIRSVLLKSRGPSA